MGWTGSGHGSNTPGEPVAELHLSEVELDALADVLAERVQARLGAGSPWLDAGGRGGISRVQLSRLRKLTMHGDLPCTATGAGCCTGAKS